MSMRPAKERSRKLLFLAQLVKYMGHGQLFHSPTKTPESIDQPNIIAIIFQLSFIFFDSYIGSACLMMANTTTAHGLCTLGLFTLLLLAARTQRSSAFQFTVGGKSGWIVPADGSPVYNQWAENSRFQIGDSLLFVYSGSNDSVLRVTKEEYINCNTSSYIEKYSDGHTVFTFNQSGPFYFISGNKDNCLKNEKLVVVVLADRSKKTTSPASPPSLSAEHAPSPAPMATHSPPPPPPPPPRSSGVASSAMSYTALAGALLVTFTKFLIA
ncbi:hypothetical protein Dimus_012545 [Dionaea muscipula]